VMGVRSKRAAPVVEIPVTSPVVTNEAPASLPLPVTASPVTKPPEREPDAAPARNDRPGTLQVVLRQWADVSIDGKSIGRQQLGFKRPLPPGKYTLTFTNSDYKPRTQVVSIRSGDKTQLIIDFEP